MPEHETQYAEAQVLMGLIFRVAERAKDDFTAVAAECGLSPVLARAVLILEEPAPMHEIAGHLACDPSYVTNIADQLETQHLAERAAGEDRRVKMLRLTPAGLEMRQRLQEALAAGSSMRGSLNPRQRADLEKLLEQMLA